MTAQRMALYLGSQKVSAHIGSQKVTPVNSTQGAITLTFIAQGEGGYIYPENITLNGNAISENSIVNVQNGESCTVAITYGSSSYLLSIYLDNVLVQSGFSNISYTFTPTSSHTVGVSRSTDKS